MRTKPLPYDIFSWHYQKVTGRLGSHKMPVLHDEFAHVSCYNIENLKEENSSRAFWGESIRRGWERIFHTDGALGCAIWAGIDDVFICQREHMSGINLIQIRNVQVTANGAVFLMHTSA